MNKSIFSLFLLWMLLTLTACNVSPKEKSNPSELSKSTEPAAPSDPATEGENQEFSSVIFAMDTVMNVKYYGNDENLLSQIEKEVNDLENIFSTTKAGSDIYRLNQSGQANVADDTEELLKKALELCDKTDGALDLSIFPIVKAWGFTTGEYQVPTEDKIRQLLTKVDYKQIRQEGNLVSLGEGMEIDLGSVAKGYTADKIIQLLTDKHVRSALINLGGNVHALGHKPNGDKWRIAIQDPKSSDVLGTVSVTDQAVVTSGGYERYFEDNGKIYWHIMDPKTGYPANNGLISVTIISPSGLYADALSTSLFIKGLEESIRFWKTYGGFEAVFVDENGELFVTEGLEDAFTLMESYQNKTVHIIRKN